MIQSHLPTHFEPSSSALLAMIASAEAKFAGDREQAQLRKEAKADARMERFLIAQAGAQRWRRLYGSPA